MLKELLISFLICLVIGSVINGINPTSPDQDSSTKASGNNSARLESDSAGENAALKTTSDETFDQDVLASAVPVLVDFSAKWCGACRKMSPIIQELASQYTEKLKIYTVDVDANPQLTSRFNIKSLPTFIVFAKGKQVEQQIGSVPKETLSDLIEKQLSM